ncbi:WG repeat-containing protein [Sphingobacterium deserti]|uniref:KWG Leptospira repeat protein n=1 Tax=Sphingobacterium deserti TaxID=1229276 RepID=A0A0B8T3J6_9SPHI|nr:WG repeat-containing protein [Sphingobacterium deserti]KGE13648.1 hypothetical protein DI53_2569 [Sphingobacterium deserti]
MIRTIVIAALFLCHFFGIAQEQKLYLFISADSLKQGVKDQNGRVIIPDDHPAAGYWSDGELIADTIIDFYGMPVNQHFAFDSLQAAYTGNTTFDRKGNVLYHPFLFDNGADYIREGARRFVDIKSRKMGLVHPYGKILIPAQYDFISPVESGYVRVYNGVKRKIEAGGEHWSIIPDPLKKYETFVLNKDGKRVDGRETSTPDAPVSLWQDSLYYPSYYAAADEKEQKLLLRIAQDPDVQELFAEDNAAYSIIERPSREFPYYVIGCAKQFAPSYILIDREGALYHFDYYKPKMPLKAYLASNKGI